MFLQKTFRNLMPFWVKLDLNDIKNKEMKKIKLVAYMRMLHF